MQYIERHIEHVLLAMMNQFKVVLVTGPRQVGKSTTIKHILPSYEYVSLDDMRELEMAKTDPGLFFKNHTLPLVIDEVQYAPELFRQIKLICDKTDLKGQICLTGSQTYLLMQNVSESLAGRIGILEMQGMSARELNGVSFDAPFIPTNSYIDERKKALKPYNHIWSYIFRGSMPELCDSKINWSMYYRSYVQSYIERDVRSMMNIKDVHVFYKFMVALASRTGMLFNAQDIANTIDVTIKTVQSWISILEASGIIYFLHPYENNILKRTTKKSKIYFYDTGLVCYLVGWDNEEVAKNGAMSGALMESFVVSEIAKSYLNSGKDMRSFFFYRDRNQKEIDLLIYHSGSLYPVEIKSTTHPKAEMAKNFTVLKNTEFVSIQSGTILSQVDRIITLSDKLRAIPIEYI